MQTKLIPAQELINTITQHMDPMDEWGEWIVGQVVQYSLENQPTNLRSLLGSLFDDKVITIILEQHEDDFKRIDLDTRLHAKNVIDFEVNHLGVFLQLREENGN